MTREWGILIALYLFLGGMSAGLLMLSAAAALFAPERLQRTAAIGAALAPWPVIVGAGLLVFDLGQPFYFWKLFVAFSPRSPMWLGTWLIALFSVVSLIYATTFLFEPETWRRRLAWAGLPLGAGLALYTGVLLGVLVSRPLWKTPLLAQLFLVSALSSACALLLITLGRGTAGHERHVLARTDAVLIVLELIVLSWMMITARTSVAAASTAASLVVSGSFAWVFWTAVVLLGLLLPLGIELAELAGPRRTDRLVGRLVSAAPAFVLLGGLALRFVMVYAGQVSHL
jgi:formate-dependent nitrite reductase membrane component NrfD